MTDAMPLPRPVSGPGSPAQQQGSSAIDPRAPCHKGWPRGAEESVRHVRAETASRAPARPRARSRTSFEPSQQLSSPRQSDMYPEPPSQPARCPEPKMGCLSARRACRNARTSRSDSGRRPGPPWSRSTVPSTPEARLPRSVARDHGGPRPRAPANAKERLSLLLPSWAARGYVELVVEGTRSTAPYGAAVSRTNCGAPGPCRRIHACCCALQQVHSCAAAHTHRAHSHLSQPRSAWRG